MSFRLLFLFAACLPLLVACGNRFGEPRPDPLGPLRAEFDAADRDGDEALDRDEAVAGMPRVADAFEAIDTDLNGVVSAAELGSYLQWQRILRYRWGESYRTTP